MKKLLSILFMIVSVQVFAQDNVISAITITLPTSPDANTANWGTGKSLFVISATGQMTGGRVNPILEESRILVIIKQGGNKVCGAYTSNSAPAADFNTLRKVWSGANAASLLGKDCTLPAGDYEVSVQFFGNGPAGTIPLSDEKTKPFTIRGNDQQAYQPPQGISPATGTLLAEADIKKPITFRWTPVIPKPQDPVTYRFTVWQLMQGQTGTQAIKANQPIITKDVDNLTQAVITNIVDGPCRPPLLCDFVWNVQALNREGKAIGGNKGTSEINTFSFNSSASADVVRGNIFGDGGARAQTTLEHGGIKQNPGWNLTTVDNKGRPAQQIDLENGQLKQNPKYLTAGDNKGKPDSDNFRQGLNSKGRPSSIVYGGTVEVKQGDNSLVFHWKVNNPAPGQTYSLSIIFKKSDEDAIEANAPVFEEKGIKETSFAFPASARKKLLNQAPVGTLSGELKKYAWVVTAWDSSGKQSGESKQYILGVNLTF